MQRAKREVLRRALGAVCLVLFAGLIALHVALIAGVPVSALVWGESPTSLGQAMSLQVCSAGAVVYLLFMAWLSARASGLLSAGKTRGYVLAATFVLSAPLALDALRHFKHPQSVAEMALGCACLVVAVVPCVLAWRQDPSLRASDV